MAFRSITTLFLLGASLFAATTNAQIGTYEVDRADEGRHSGGSSVISTYKEHAVVYAPRVEKTFPIIFFMSGLAGKIEVPKYSQILIDIASSGYVIIGIDKDRFPPQFPEQGDSFNQAMTWGKTLLNEWMETKGLLSRGDADHVIIMGQSAGNHVLVQSLRDWTATACTSAVKGVVWIDPVDGKGPGGGSDRDKVISWPTYPNDAPAKLNFDVPTLHILCGLDPLGGFGGMSCAPAELSNERFYLANPGPVWQMNFIHYGHEDCLDSKGWLALCPSCKKLDGSSNRPCPDTRKYRSAISTKVLAFADGLFQGGEAYNTMLTEMTDAATFESLGAGPVTLKHELNGHDVSTPRTGGACGGCYPVGTDCSAVSLRSASEEKFYDPKSASLAKGGKTDSVLTGIAVAVGFVGAAGFVAAVIFVTKR